MTNDQIETLESLEDDITLAVKELEDRHIPVTIKGVYDALGKRYDIRTIREFMWYLYPDTPETMVECSGCKSGWCKSRQALCVPDISLFD